MICDAEGDQKLMQVNGTSSPEPSSPLLSTTSQVALDHSWRKQLFTRVSHLMPHFWPSQYPKSQFTAVLCLLVLVLGRVVNVLAPLTLGALITSFDTQNIPPSPPSGSSTWPYLIIYVILCFLSSSGGLAALLDTLWIPISQYSDRSMSTHTFNYILALSLGRHTKHKTGELLRILDRVTAVNRAGKLIVFTVLPMLVDVAIAVIVFMIRFELALGMLIGAVMVLYIWAIVVLTRYRTRIQRMDDQDVTTREIHTDGLLNYETVKYFGGEEYETQRYAMAIGEYQIFERKSIFTLNLLNFMQSLVVTCGLLVGSTIMASRITSGKSNTNDFVVFIAYYAQLYFPLSHLGGVYRSIDQSFTDAEKLLNLLAEPTEVVDALDAKELVVENGEVEFESVSFSYDGITPLLKNISFKVPCGGHLALVGESGAGKSTILRLLYRLYDLQPGQGRILIDGQDIRTVTLSSLRNAIGVVPHDPVLFNASVGYNIAYGQPSMTPPSQSTIIDAAQAAQIHDRIMSFPEEYETKVGVRGARLSNNEKRQVAIARTIAKNPRILLLDEATSALDGAMERVALGRLMDGRSCLSIPHRLGTIKDTDVIVVLREGSAVEQGSRKELLGLNGLFASMWAGHINASEEPMTYEAPVVDVPEPEAVAVPSLQMKEDTMGLSFTVSDGSPSTSSFSAPDSVPLAFLSNADVPSVDRPDHHSRARGASVTFDAGALNTSHHAGSPEPGSGRRMAHGIQRLARRISVGGGKLKLANLSGQQHGSSTGSIASGSAGGSVSPPASMDAQANVEESQHVERAKEQKRKKRRSFV